METSLCDNVNNLLPPDVVHAAFPLAQLPDYALLVVMKHLEGLCKRILTFAPTDVLSRGTHRIPAIAGG